MHYRFLTLAILHRHGDLQPGEVEYVMPVARGEIQLAESDDLRAFCMSRARCPMATCWSACPGHTPIPLFVATRFCPTNSSQEPGRMRRLSRHAPTEPFTSGLSSSRSWLTSSHLPHNRKPTHWVKSSPTCS